MSQGSKDTSDATQETEQVFSSCGMMTDSKNYEDGSGGVVMEDPWYVHTNTEKRRLQLIIRSEGLLLWFEQIGSSPRCWDALTSPMHSGGHHPSSPVATRG